jgi:hypothetical protein
MLDACVACASGAPHRADGIGGPPDSESPALDHACAQEVESFLHRSGRTGRANRAGTAVAMYTAREGRYLSRILKDTSITNCEMVSPPGPKQVMESSAKAVSCWQLGSLSTGVAAVAACPCSCWQQSQVLYMCTLAFLPSQLSK